MNPMSQATLLERIRSQFFYSNSATGITVTVAFLLAIAIVHVVDSGDY